MTTRRILIVDDEAMIRQLIVDKLTNDGFEAVSLPSPISAIQLLNKENGNFDLIVTDFKMPEMSGLDFAKAVNGKYPEIPIIVISGYGTNDEIMNFLKNGVYDYLAKPFALKDLVNSINSVLEGNRPNTIATTNDSSVDITTQIETSIFDARPKVIRTLKIIEEIIEESTSRSQKQKLQQAHNFTKEVSSILIEVTEFLKKISKT